MQFTLLDAVNTNVMWDCVGPTTTSYFHEGHKINSVRYVFALKTWLLGRRFERSKIFTMVTENEIRLPA